MYVYTHMLLPMWYFVIFMSFDEYFKLWCCSQLSTILLTLWLEIWCINIHSNVKWSKRMEIMLYSFLLYTDYDYGTHSVNSTRTIFHEPLLLMKNSFNFQRKSFEWLCRCLLLILSAVCWFSDENSLVYQIFILENLTILIQFSAIIPHMCVCALNMI